jgi:hypothetical protein
MLRKNVSTQVADRVWRRTQHRTRTQLRALRLESLDEARTSIAGRATGRTRAFTLRQEARSPRCLAEEEHALCRLLLEPLGATARRPHRALAGCVEVEAAYDGAAPTGSAAGPSPPNARARLSATDGIRSAWRNHLPAEDSLSTVQSA